MTFAPGDPGRSAPATADAPCPIRDARPGELPGVQLGRVAAPADLDQAAALVALAHRDGLVTAVRGAGSKLGGRVLPPRVELLIGTDAWQACRFDPDTGLVTAGAGGRVAVLQDELARLGRRLMLDPLTAASTVGGMLATAETGPLGHLFGPPAVQLADATIVLPDGTVEQVAGRVARRGDESRELRRDTSGRPGTVPLVVETVLRSQPLPEQQNWVLAPFTQPAQAADLRDAILRARLGAAAVELDLPAVRRTPQGLALRANAGTIGVLFEGPAGEVTERCRRLAALLGPGTHTSRQAPPWWGRYPYRPDEVGLALTVPDGVLHPVIYALVDAVGAPVPIRGSIGSGRAWAALPADLPLARIGTVVESVRAVLLARAGQAWIESAPPDLRDAVAPYRTP